MEIENVTGAMEKLRCSAGWSCGKHEQLIYLSAFNIFLSITAVLGNTLILLNQGGFVVPIKSILLKSILLKSIPIKIKAGLSSYLPVKAIHNFLNLFSLQITRDLETVFM